MQWACCKGQKPFVPRKIACLNAQITQGEQEVVSVMSIHALSLTNGCSRTWFKPALNTTCLTTVTTIQISRVLGPQPKTSTSSMIAYRS